MRMLSLIAHILVVWGITAAAIGLGVTVIQLPDLIRRWRHRIWFQKWSRVCARWRALISVRL